MDRIGIRHAQFDLEVVSRGENLQKVRLLQYQSLEVAKAFGGQARDRRLGEIPERAQTTENMFLVSNIHRIQLPMEADLAKEMREACATMYYTYKL